MLENKIFKFFLKNFKLMNQARICVKIKIFSVDLIKLKKLTILPSKNKLF